MNNLGFIGLGNMGKGMVENLLKNGLNVSGYDIDKEVFSKLENPKDFFSSFTYHYNERGYYLVYERILKELN